MRGKYLRSISLIKYTPLLTLIEKNTTFKYEEYSKLGESEKAAYIINRFQLSDVLMKHLLETYIGAYKENWIIGTDNKLSNLFVPNDDWPVTELIMGDLGSSVKVSAKLTERTETVNLFDTSYELPNVSETHTQDNSETSGAKYDNGKYPGLLNFFPDWKIYLEELPDAEKTNPNMTQLPITHLPELVLLRNIQRLGYLLKYSSDILNFEKLKKYIINIDNYFFNDETLRQSNIYICY